MGSSWRRTSGRPPPSMTGISAVTTNWRASSLRSSSDIAVAGRPACRGLAIAAGHEVHPGGRAAQAIVHRRAQIVDVRAPDRDVLGALHGLQPHAAHLGLDLARPVAAHAATRPVAQRLGAVHGARHASRVQHALPAHLAVPDRALDRVLDARHQTRGVHAGTRARRNSMSSLAFLTAEDASAEYPSAPT